MPRPLVVDASFAFRLLLPGPQQDLFGSLVTQWLRDGYALHAPALWMYEITSAMCKAVWMGELTPDEGEHMLALAQAMDVTLVPPGKEQARLAFAWTGRLKRANAYDSFYLSLAETLGCDLWTVDRRLCNAVNLPWVRWVGVQ